MINTKELPILFSTAMVQAILDNRKMMTRRLMKPQPVKNGSFYEWAGAGWSTEGPVTPVAGHSLSERCPYGRPGDILWVREAHLYYTDENAEGAILYKSDEHAEEFAAGLFEDFKPKWKKSIHMPKEAARIWLMVKSVRVERLQDISEEDAKAEGVIKSNSKDVYLNYTDEAAASTQFIYNCHSAKASFISLWNLINGRDRSDTSTWFNNPWVWVVEFEVLSTTGKPDNI